MKSPSAVEGDPFETIGIVQEIREKISKDLAIIIDANQGWLNAGLAIDIIRKLEPFDVLIEQPILAHDYEGLAEISRSVKSPIIADESAFTTEGLLKIIQTRSAHIINVKVTRPGGLYRAQSLIGIARAGGIRCQIDDVSETRISTTTSAHLAASVPSGTYWYWSAGPAHMWLEEDIVKEGGVTIEGALATIPSGPGLGLVLDEDVLRKNAINV